MCTKQKAFHMNLQERCKWILWGKNRLCKLLRNCLCNTCKKNLTEDSDTDTNSWYYSVIIASIQWPGWRLEAKIHKLSFTERWGNISGVDIINASYLNSFPKYLLLVRAENKVLEQTPTTEDNSLTQQMESVRETISNREKNMAETNTCATRKLILDLLILLIFPI